MALLKQEKKNIINQNQRHAKDTGSSEVQIAILTSKINYLSRHLKKNLKDIVARRKLLKKVAQRKRLTRYLETKNK